MDVDVILAGEEEAIADWEVGEALFFFVGEFEDVGEDVDGGGRLFEEKLHGGVGDDGAAHFSAHEVFDVLSDGGEAEVVFACALSEREEEVCRIFMVHELPSLIDDEDATFLVGADDIPDVRKHNIHRNRAELVF